MSAETLPDYVGLMSKPATTSEAIAKFGALLADETRAEILCSLMDGRAYTGTELSRHIGVAPSTVSEHLSKLIDAEIVAVEAQGRHRYWRLADPDMAQLLEAMGAQLTSPAKPKAPAHLAHIRTCYDHLAGELAVAIYDGLVESGHLTATPEQLVLEPTGFELLASIGADVDAIRSATRPKARPCLDWTQRRHHLAGEAAKAMLEAFKANDWLKAGAKPRTVRLTEVGRVEVPNAFGLPAL